jgi:hypothetical protein
MRILNRPLLRHIPLLILVAIVPGCIIVRTTEHWITLHKDGSGEALLRLVDLRSDGVTDSAVVRDYGIMMGDLEKNGYGDFEKSTRKVTGARFFVHGDTLGVDVRYTFRALAAVEGLRVTNDELYMIIPPGKEIVRTNGSVSESERNTERITWARNAEHLMYVVRERRLPPSVSLAPLYLKYGR